MCELLGMSANVPTDICFSFAGLIRRGGETGPHQDGWGISFFEDGKGVREFKDAGASSSSELAEFVKNYPIKSNVVLSHIRQANSGKVCLANTHPFTREMWGYPWVYVHNGQLKGIKKYGLDCHLPMGTTDSEYALCYLLGQLKEQFPNYPKSPNKLFKELYRLFREINKLGVFNVMLSDSKHLYCYCSTKLFWIRRAAPFGEAVLKDDDIRINFVDETTPNDVVSVIATQPLTENETWNQMEPGEMLVFKLGEVVKRFKP